MVFFEYNRVHADMAELADALVSGSSENTHAGSSPVIRTKHKKVLLMKDFFECFVAFGFYFFGELFRINVCLIYLNMEVKKQEKKKNH